MVVPLQTHGVLCCARRDDNWNQCEGLVQPLAWGSHAPSFILRHSPSEEDATSSHEDNGDLPSLAFLLFLRQPA